MVICSACGKDSGSAGNNGNTQTQTSGGTASNSDAGKTADTTPAASAQGTTENGTGSANDALASDERFSEDYYNQNTYLGVEPYDPVAYADICPFVGRWYDKDADVFYYDNIGFYFYPDGYAARVHGNGAVSPITTSCYVQNGVLTVDDWGMSFTIEDGRLRDNSGETYPYEKIEYPSSDIPTEFTDCWCLTEIEDLTNYIAISYGGYEPVYSIRENYAVVAEGDGVMASPSCLVLLDENGEPFNSLVMESEGLCIDSDGVTWYQMPPEEIDDSVLAGLYGEDDPEEFYDTEDLEDFYESYRYPFYDDPEPYDDSMEAAVSQLRGFVGYWFIKNDTSPYRYDEDYAFSGFIIYADGVWTPLNQNGIASSFTGSAEVNDEGIALIDPYNRIPDIQLHFDYDEDYDLCLADGDGGMYTNMYDVFGPEGALLGVPTEALGIWSSEDEYAELGTFKIRIDGIVTFPEDEDMPNGKAYTMGRNICIILDTGEEYDFNIEELTADRLIGGDMATYEHIE